MNFADVFGVLAKGLKYLPMAISAGKNVKSTVIALRDLAQAASNGTVTPEQIQSTDEKLDALIERFNRPI